jgi:hypothetical protein
MTMSATDPDWTAWARNQLPLRESIPHATARQAFLQRLEEEDFLPPAHLPYVLAVLEAKAGSPGPNEEVSVAEVADCQRLRVEGFARQFFQIPVGQRREQWLRWKASCAGVPALTARLDRLEPGLDLDPQRLVVADPKLRELILEASGIFVLRPFEAAQGRAMFFQRTGTSSEDMAQWETAVRNLQKKYPNYVILAPELIEGVLRWRNCVMELARRRAFAQARQPGSRVMRKFAPPPAKKSDTFAVDRKMAAWVWIGVIVGWFVLGGVLHFVFDSRGNGPTYQRRQQEENEERQKSRQDSTFKSEETKREVITITLVEGGASRVESKHVVHPRGLCLLSTLHARLSPR